MHDALALQDVECIAKHGVTLEKRCRSGIRTSGIVCQQNLVAGLIEKYVGRDALTVNRIAGRSEITGCRQLDGAAVRQRHDRLYRTLAESLGADNRRAAVILHGARDRFLGEELVKPSLDLCDRARAEIFPEATQRSP